MALFAKIAKKIKRILIQKTVFVFLLIKATLVTSLISFGKCFDFKFVRLFK